MLHRTKDLLNTSTAEFKVPSSTNGKGRARVNGGNGHRRRVRHRIHRGYRRAALKADTAVLLVKSGMDMAEAIERCATSTDYFYAMKALKESGNVALHNTVLKGNEPVRASAKRVKNAAAAIKAYAKFSRYELYLFEAKTGAVRDLAKHITNSDPVEAAAALIKATGSIDAAVDLLIAAERSIVSMVPVSKPVVEAEVEPGIATEEISPEDDSESADWWKELMGEGTRPQEI